MQTVTLVGAAAPEPDAEFAAIIRAGYTLPTPREHLPSSPAECVDTDPLVHAIAVRFTA